MNERTLPRTTQDESTRAIAAASGPGAPCRTPPEGLSVLPTAVASAHLSLASHSPSGEAVPPYVRRALDGDASAFTELYRAHRRDVARLVGRILGPRGDVDDVVQDVFVQVFRSLQQFRGESRFATWLHRVSVNVSLMHLRAARSRPRLAPESTDDVTPDDAASPLDDAARSERLRALYRILDTLSEKKRTVFILHEVEAVSAHEIARIVGSPVLTVRTRLFYARREVYKAMADEPSLASIAAEFAPENDNETDRG